MRPCLRRNTSTFAQRLYGIAALLLLLAAPALRAENEIAFLIGLTPITRYEFKSTKVGQNSPTVEFTVANVSDKNILFKPGAVVLVDGNTNVFRLTKTPSRFPMSTLAPGDKVEFEAYYTPSGPVLDSATFLVMAIIEGETATREFHLKVYGYGLVPNLAVKKDTVFANANTYGQAIEVGQTVLKNEFVFWANTVTDAVSFRNIDTAKIEDIRFEMQQPAGSDQAFAVVNTPRPLVIDPNRTAHQLFEFAPKSNESPRQVAKVTAVFDSVGNDNRTREFYIVGFVAQPSITRVAASINFPVTRPTQLRTLTDIALFTNAAAATGPARIRSIEVVNERAPDGSAASGIFTITPSADDSIANNKQYILPLITFAPPYEGFWRAELRIVTNGNSDTDTLIIPIMGSSSDPGIAVMTDTLNFGPVRIGRRLEAELPVWNTAPVELDVTDAPIAPAGTFSLATSLPRTVLEDTLRVRFAFAPTALGPAVASARLVNNTSKTPSVALLGQGVIGTLALSDTLAAIITNDTLEVGGVRSGGSITARAALKNIGGHEYFATRILIEEGHLADFAFVDAQGNVSNRIEITDQLEGIPVDSLLRFALRFTPTAPGRRHVRISVTGNDPVAKIAEPEYSFVASGSMVDYEVATPDGGLSLSFPPTLVGTTFGADVAQQRTIVLRNNTPDAEVRLGLQDRTGSAAFSLDAQSRTIQPGDTAHIHVLFSPVAASSADETAVLYFSLGPDDAPTAITVSGRGIAPSASFAGVVERTPILKELRLVAQELKQTFAVVKISNRGEYPLLLTDFSRVPNLGSILTNADALPLMRIEPGAEDSIVITVDPALGSSFLSDTLLMTANHVHVDGAAFDSSRIALAINADVVPRDIDLRLALPAKAVVFTGRTETIPLRVLSPDRQFSDARLARIRFTLQYDPVALSLETPLSPTDDVAVTLQDDNRGTATVTLEGLNGRFVAPDTGLVASIKAKILFGGPVASMISIPTASIQVQAATDVIADGSSVLVELDGSCLEDKRGISVTGEPYLRVIDVFNSHTVSVAFGVVTDEPTSLAVVSSQGTVVWSSADASASRAGDYSMTIPTDQLPQGTFFLQLRNGISVLSTKFIVVR